MAFSPVGTYVVSVGDISTEDLLNKLDFLYSWKGKTIDLPDTKIDAKDNSTKVMYLVDVEKAAQSELRVGKVTDMPYDATGEYYKTYLANYPLGGAFNSRINLNLREDKGYTYGARTWFYSTDQPQGVFMASAGVLASATDSALYEMLNEIKMYNKDGITKDELSFMKSSNWPTRCEEL